MRTSDNLIRISDDRSIGDGTRETNYSMNVLWLVVCSKVWREYREYTVLH